MRRPLLAAAAALSLALPARGGDAEPVPEKALLLQVAEEHGEARAPALAAWKRLSSNDRATLLRAYLRSGDPALAFAAAVVASPLSLDLEELHLQSRALRLDPLAPFLPPAGLAEIADGHLAFGSEDLPAIWKALGTRDPDPQKVGYSRFHRCLLPAQVPDLVPLLESARPTPFRGLLWDLMEVADSEASEDRHDDYVRAFRYGLARLRAEAEGRRRPTLAGVAAPPERHGLPADFLDLAEATWVAPEKGFGLGGLPERRAEAGATATPTEFTSRGPVYWLHRWALRLEPAEDDVPFLLATVRSGAALGPTRAWAARRLAALEGRAAGHALAQVLEDGGAPAVMAAAEAASRGRPDAWKALDADAPTAKDLREAFDAQKAEARWLADPAAARAAAWEEMRRGETPKELGEEPRWFLAYDEDVHVRDEDLRWIADRLRAEGAPLPVEAWFYARAMPEALTKEVAERFAARWAGEADRIDGFDDTFERALAPMAALAPDATVACLRRWATEGKDEDDRGHALVLLARLGDAALVDRLLAAWPFRGAGASAHVLGRVKDPRVEAFLRRQVEAPDPNAPGDGGRADDALCALAVYYGCPEPLAQYLSGVAHPGDIDPKVWAEAKARVLDQDPIGAVLARTAGGPFEGASLDVMSGFGLSQDPRVRQRILAWREDRGRGLYWETTGVLAMLGDEAARREWGAFLGEARTFLLDDLQDGRLFTMDGDPAWTASWLARLDTNCCYEWHAQAVIEAMYPTFPFPDYPGMGARARRGGERWFEKHRGTFAHSAILDGWIPVAR